MKTILIILFLFTIKISYSQEIFIDSIKFYLIELINQERVNKKSDILFYDNKLELSAQKHTNYMFYEKVFSHDELNINSPYYSGLNPWDRDCKSEICLKSVLQFTNNKDIAKFMFNSWCKSNNHYNSIINKNYKYIGIYIKVTMPTNNNILKLFNIISTITFY